MNRVVNQCVHGRKPSGSWKRPQILRPHGDSILCAARGGVFAMARRMHTSAPFADTSGKPAEGEKVMSNKNWKWNALAIATVVAAAAAPASAEDFKLEASIPFAFSINKMVNLAPGNYVVTHDRNVWWFRNEATLEGVAIVNYSGHQGQAAENPSLTFECAGANCRLRAIYVGGTELGAEVPVPKLRNSERVELLSVALKPIRGR
jgi:hypothetical protein